LLAFTERMKRPPFSAPRRILEVLATPRPDPRADPQATTKISRAELDAVLHRTRSGTRRAIRPETVSRDPAPPESLEELPGPRDDDAPEITIRKIESVEIDLSGDPVLVRAPTPSLSPPARISPLSPISPVAAFTPSSPPRHEIPAEAPPRMGRHPRVSVAVWIFVIAALVAAFFAGRVSVHW
jgi:hypothetical protein